MKRSRMFIFLIWKRKPMGNSMPYSLLVPCHIIIMHYIKQTAFGKAAAVRRKGRSLIKQDFGFLSKCCRSQLSEPWCKTIHELSVWMTATQCPLSVHGVMGTMVAKNKTRVLCLPPPPKYRNAGQIFFKLQRKNIGRLFTRPNCLCGGRKSWL